MSNWVVLAVQVVICIFRGHLYRERRSLKVALQLNCWKAVGVVTPFIWGLLASQPHIKATV